MTSRRATRNPGRVPGGSVTRRCSRLGLAAVTISGSGSMSRNVRSRSRRTVVTPARGPPPIDLPWRTQRVRADQQVYAKRAAVVAAECDARAADVVFADPEQQ